MCGLRGSRFREPDDLGACSVSPRAEANRRGSASDLAQTNHPTAIRRGGDERRRRIRAGGYRREQSRTRWKAMDIRVIDGGLEQVAADFHELLDSATNAEFRAATNGTKWTNKQLLFHMLFAFVLVRTPLILVKGLSRLPDPVSRMIAAALNAATRPFHVVNYLCALPGGRVLSGAAMVKLMDRTIGQLRARLARESERTSKAEPHLSPAATALRKRYALVVACSPLLPSFHTFAALAKRMTPRSG